MIVNCPECAARYRIRDEKIKGRGARITCPKCTHKFVVHRDDQPMVVGATASPSRGVPVTFARGGQPSRAEAFDEDDEADVPTTVMPHGSQLAQEIRAAAEAAKARKAAVEADNRDPQPLADGERLQARVYHPGPTYGPEDDPIALGGDVAEPDEEDAMLALRAKAQAVREAQANHDDDASTGGTSRVAGLLLVALVLAVVAAGALMALGVLPMPQLVQGV